MQVTFQGDSLNAIVIEMHAFLNDLDGSEDKPKASKPKKTKAAKPVEEAPVEEAAPEPEVEEDDEMDVDDMREAMRQDMMTIYVTDDGKKFVEGKLAEYELKNFSELPEDKVEEVFTAVREFKQGMAA